MIVEEENATNYNLIKGDHLKNKDMEDV